MQRPDHFEVTADLPGFAKEEVHVDVDHGVLRITAERAETKEDDKEVKGVKYHRVERSSGSLSRAIKLPASADTDAISAKAENGVLTITVGKKAAAVADTPKRVAIA